MMSLTGGFIAFEKQEPASSAIAVFIASTECVKYDETKANHIKCWKIIHFHSILYWVMVAISMLDDRRPSANGMCELVRWIEPDNKQIVSIKIMSFYFDNLLNSMNVICEFTQFHSLDWKKITKKTYILF